MNNRMLCVLLVLAALMTGCANTDVEEETGKKDYSGTYEEKIEAYVKDHETTTAGMTVAVFDSSDTLYEGYFGYEDIESQKNITEESILEWGSCTKLLVWVSVMQLYEEGKIDLETDIREYLSEEFVDKLQYKNAITMTDLMNHRAGFQESYYDVFVREAQDVKSLEEALLCYQPSQVFEPGTVTAYSNYGCALAGYVVEEISGVPFYEYVEEHIFTPLGMENSSIRPLHSENNELYEKWQNLKCYTVDGNPLGFSAYYIALYPAGSCISNAEDFQTFAKALLNKGNHLFEKQGTWEKLMEPTSVYANTDVARNCHGLWMLPFAQPVYGHGGNTAGCSSYLLLQPENDLGVIVMTNQANESVYNIEMMKLIFGEYDRDNFMSIEHKGAPGIYKAARNAFKGALKLMSLTFYNFEGEPAFYVWDEGADIVQMPYGDYVPVSIWTMIGETGILLLWILSYVVSLIWLLARGLCMLLKKAKCKIPVHTKWIMLLQVMILIPIVLFISGVAGFKVASSYLWLCGVILVMDVAFGILFVWNVRKLRSKPRFGTLVSMFLALIPIINICYWNLFAFWIA